MRMLLLILVMVTGALTSASAKESQTPTPTCQTAYVNGLGSPSVGVVAEATEICTKAAERACADYVEKNSDGPNTGDGRYLSASCALNAAVGANYAVAKAVKTQNKSAACSRAAKAALNSPSTGDVAEAIDVCAKEKDKNCETMVSTESDGPETGDGRLVGAVCQLIATHGSYLAVSPRSAEQFPRCSGHRDHGSCKAWQDCCDKNYPGQQACVPPRCG